LAIGGRCRGKVCFAEICEMQLIRKKYKGGKALGKYLKKIIMLFALISIIGVLSGCVEATYHVTVNKDGSSDLNYRIGLNSGLVGLMGSENGDPIDNLRKDAEKNGFSVTNFNENGLIGIIAKKHVTSLQTIPVLGNAGAKSNAPSFSVEKGLFQNLYKINGNIDLSDMKSKPGDEFAQIGNAMISQIKINFVLTLPVKPGKNNASTTKDDGKTLVWQLVPGTNNQIQMEASVPNTTNIVLASIGGAVLLIVIVIVLVRSKRGRISQEINNTVDDVSEKKTEEL